MEGLTDGLRNVRYNKRKDHDARTLYIIRECYESTVASGYTHYNESTRYTPFTKST